MTSRTSILMLLAIAVVGIYVLPSVTARFAGSHTMELNQTAKVSVLACEKCHSYILDELYNDGLSNNIATKHLAAATNVLYVNGSGLLNITETDALGSGNRSACLMCHMLTLNATGGFNQTHTHTTIRVCTDEKCHGAQIELDTDTSPLTGQTYPWASDALNVTGKLTAIQDPHRSFYNALDSGSSTYTKQIGIDQGSGENYSLAFYSCLACHTHLGIRFNISRPTIFGFNMTVNLENAGMGIVAFDFETGSSYIVNDTGINVSTAEKLPGSIWS